MSNFQYDVALSFAGEDRAVAEELNHQLKSKGIRTFYDMDKQAELWGQNLIDTLGQIYGEGFARYCVILVSKAYLEKRWTKHERQAAQARALDSGEVYILPLQLDETRLPGMPSTVGYVSLKNSSVAEIAELIDQKLKKYEPAQSNGATSTQRFPLPKIRREFTDQDRGALMKSVFKHIEGYFRRGVESLQTQDSEVSGEFESINSTKFVASLFLRGNKCNRIKLWIGDDFGPEKICYSSGLHLDVKMDNAMNGWVACSDDDYELRAEFSDFGSFSDEKAIGQHAIAESLWKLFTNPLQHS